jgi:hypothetical protein
LQRKGYAGYWVEDDDAGKVRFLDEIGDSFWVLGEMRSDWFQKRFRGRRMRRGYAKVEGKGKAPRVDLGSDPGAKEKDALTSFPKHLSMKPMPTFSEETGEEEKERRPRVVSNSTKEDEARAKPKRVWKKEKLTSLRTNKSDLPSNRIGISFVLTRCFNPANDGLKSRGVTQDGGQVLMTVLTGHGPIRVCRNVIRPTHAIMAHSLRTVSEPQPQRMLSLAREPEPTVSGQIMIATPWD